jgi:acetate kinase
VLVLNCGSSTLKLQVVELDAEGRAAPRDERRPRGAIERIGSEAQCAFIDGGGRSLRHTLPIHTHEQAAQHAFAQLELREAGRIDAVGHRVVQGADRFAAPALIDAGVLAEIEALSDLAPLHNPACASGIRAARAVFGPQLPMAAVFDTAFHRTLPDWAATYAIPADLAERHRIRRYGFHGIALSFVAARYAEVSGVPAEQAKLVILHLGNGCSAAAIRHGESVDTSMGFTPLEGLMMGTRAGDLDPALVGYLARREGVSVDVVEEWLNRRSGLLGVSGRSNDMRELTAAAETDGRARLAVEMFCYRASKYVGAYLAVLGGADALIFSGGIGEHSPPVRARICEPLRWCGLVLDPIRNAETVGTEGRISAAACGLQAYVIPADEELLIARETMRCIRQGHA